VCAYTLVLVNLPAGTPIEIPPSRFRAFANSSVNQATLQVPRQIPARHREAFLVSSTWDVFLVPTGGEQPLSTPHGPQSRSSRGPRPQSLARLHRLPRRPTATMSRALCRVKQQMQLDDDLEQESRLTRNLPPILYFAFHCLRKARFLRRLYRGTRQYRRSN